MSEISSGLVAVAWIHTNESYPKKVSDMAPGYWGSAWKHDPLVRLSDAEVIISAKDAEILEQCRINGMGAEREAALLGKMERQAERIKELKSDVDEEAHIRDRMAKLLAETAVALKGPEKALHRHGWQDLPDVAAKQSAALKLARDALDACCNHKISHGDNCYVDPDHCYGNSCVCGKESLDGCIEEALAAINEVLKGE